MIQLGVGLLSLPFFIYCLRRICAPVFVLRRVRIEVYASITIVERSRVVSKDRNIG